MERPLPLTNLLQPLQMEMLLGEGWAQATAGHSEFAGCHETQRPVQPQKPMPSEGSGWRKHSVHGDLPTELGRGSAS